MKPLKTVILALMLLAIALFGASYQMPLLIEVEQSIVLSAKPEQVYPLIENPAHWEKWSAINTTADPSMIRLYSGPLAGSGARMQWNGDKVGTGEVVFTESISPDRLTYKQTERNAGGVTNGTFVLKAIAGDSTHIFWKQTIPVKDEPVARLLGFWLKYKKQEELEKGLAGLQNLLLKNTARPGPKLSLALSK